MVFPLYDDNPFKRAKVPYVTWGLILLNVGIFLLELGATDNGVKALLASFAATPAAITHQVPSAGRFPPELTLFSYMFLHGGWEHILGNMIYLWVFGDDIEDALGHVRFSVFYVLPASGPGSSLPGSTASRRRRWSAPPVPSRGFWRRTCCCDRAPKFRCLCFDLSCGCARIG